MMPKNSPTSAAPKMTVAMIGTIQWMLGVDVQAKMNRPTLGVRTSMAGALHIRAKDLRQKDTAKDDHRQAVLRRKEAVGLFKLGRVPLVHGAEEDEAEHPADRQTDECETADGGFPAAL